MNEKELKELANIYWRDYFDFSSSYEDHKRVDWLINDLEFNSVLEVGCGNGGGIEKLLKAGKKAIGLEYSEYLYKNYLYPKFGDIVVLSDVCELPFEDNSFDVICSFDVLEHLPEYKIDKAIKEIYRVTKKYFYGSISEREDVNKKFHLTVKPYEWWLNKFLKVGFKNIKNNNISELHIYEKNR